MNPLFKLLDDKLYWYKKYLSCNEAYLIAITHAPEIAIDEIELFYGNRESLLKILESLDEKIQSNIKTENRDSSADERTKIQYYIREKDSIIERIIDLDKKIIQEMELIKNQGEEKIKSLVKGKKALSKYKSSPRANERLDKRV